MTRNNKTKFTAKNILTFVLAVLMCVSLCFAFACKNDDTSSKTPEYSYTDVDNGTIKNPNFTYGTVIMDYDDYPKTTVTGWNLNKNSSAKSGVIDVSELGWKEFMYNVYGDTGMMNYVKSLNGDFTDSEIKQLIKNENINANPKAEDVKKYVVENYLLKSENPKEGIVHAFLNPGTPTDAADNKIYMLNNYKTSDLGFGSIQTLTSASEVTLKPGEYAKVTVSVKTANLNTANSSIGYGEEIGANIRIKNSFNSNSQAPFGVYNITCTEWTDYSFYVKADAVYETKFTVELGLGYDNCYAEGTAYFDDVRVEILEKDDVSSLTFVEKGLKYNELDNDELKLSAKNYDKNNNYLYNMSLDMLQISNTFAKLGSFDNRNDSFTEYNFVNGVPTANGNPTGASSVTVTNQTDLTDVPYGITDGIKVEIKNKPASYSIKLEDNFEVNSEKYYALTFFIKNELNKLYATDITVNVLDIYQTYTVERPAVASISEVSDDWTKLTVLVKNNFDRKSYTTPRYFNLEIVIGPDTYQDVIDNYALGTVYITNPIVSTGVSYQYEDDTAKENDNQTEYYDYYSLLKATANGTTALYAGSPNDFAADEADSTVYNLTVAPSDIGTILTKPATPKNYTGVESGHFYIGGEEDVVNINTNSNSGLINTKYLDKYNNDIANALNHTDDDAIQPLMITSANGKSYGFIGENNKISANSKAKISLKIKVTGGANAFVYLVDTTTTEKSVLKFDAFTINTDAGFNEDITNKNIAEKELLFNLTDTEDWVTLEFYIATGDTAKEFRLEFWNGSRSDTTTTNNDGFVFVNDVNVSTTNGFTEQTRWENVFSVSGNPLYDYATELRTEDGKPKVIGNLIAHQRELTEREVQYNNDSNKEGFDVEYSPKYVWAQTDNFIYAIYDTIDPTHSDPYDNEPIDTETEEETLIKTDPATFWLSFSSILLGVALLVAIVMLFVKNIRRRHKANASDAKSHYTVKSRISKQKPEKKTKVKKQEIIDEDVDVKFDEDNLDTNEEELVDEEKEQTLDDYVYGEVQDFGEKDNQETNQDAQKIDE